MFFRAVTMLCCQRLILKTAQMHVIRACTCITSSLEAAQCIIARSRFPLRFERSWAQSARTHGFGWACSCSRGRSRSNLGGAALKFRTRQWALVLLLSRRWGRRLRNNTSRGESGKFRASDFKRGLHILKVLEILGVRRPRRTQGSGKRFPFVTDAAETIRERTFGLEGSRADGVVVLELPLQLDAFQSGLLCSVQQKAALGLLTNQCSSPFRCTLRAATLEGLLRCLLSSIALSSQGAVLSLSKQFGGVIIPTPVLENCQVLGLCCALLRGAQFLLKLNHPLRRVLRLTAELSIVVLSSAKTLLQQLVCCSSLP